MLREVDRIPPYERMHILVISQDIENSHHLDNTQKTVMMRLLQQIVDEWTKHEVQHEEK